MTRMELAKTICFWVVVGTGCIVFFGIVGYCFGIVGYWLDRGVTRLLRLLGRSPHSRNSRAGGESEPARRQGRQRHRDLDLLN